MNITATQTNTRNSKAMAYFKFRLGEMKVLVAINCMLAVLFFPVIAAVFARYSHYTDESTTLIAFNFGSVILAMTFIGIGILFMSYVCAISAFNHLHNKNICDMHLSLPLTHRQRFWTNYTTGLSVTIIPYISSSLIGLFIFRIFSSTKGMNELFNELKVSGYEAFTVKYLIPIMLTGLVVLVFTYSLTVFCNTLGGNGFMSAFLPILASAAIPILILTLTSMGLVNARGIDSVGGYPYIISSPIGYLVGSIYLFVTHQIFSVNMPVYIIPVLLIITGLVISAFFFSKNIKAENIGRDFLYRSIYNVQQGIIILCITSTFGGFFIRYNYSAIIFWAIVVSFIAYFVGHVVHYKGLHKMKNGLIKYGAMALSSLLICVIVVAGKGFGAESYLPFAGEIQGVKIYNYSNNGITFETTLDDKVLEKLSYHWNFIRDTDYTKEQWTEITQEIRRIHKSFIDNPNTLERSGDIFGMQYFGDYSRHYYNVTIEYELKNGFVVKRQYYYHDSDVDMLIDKGILYEQVWEHNWGDGLWDYGYNYPDEVYW